MERFAACRLPYIVCGGSQTGPWTVLIDIDLSKT